MTVHVSQPVYSHLLKTSTYNLVTLKISSRLQLQNS